MKFMDKLREALMVNRTGGRRVVMTKLDTINVEDQFNPMVGCPDTTEYSIRCTYGRNAYVRNEHRGVTEMKEMILHDICEGIFGNAKEKLRELEFAIYNDDDRYKIADLLRELRQEMSV